MSTIETKNIKQMVISSTTQPLKIGGILEDGSDAKISIDTSGSTSIVSPTITGTIPQESWHNVGATGEPAFQNSWVNYGAVWANCSYMKDSMGFVHLQGLIKSGVSYPIFTLPIGYRPSKELYFIANVGNNAYGLTINASGVVYTASVGGSFYSLDGVTFKAEQ